MQTQGKLLKMLAAKLGAAPGNTGWIIAAVCFFGGRAKWVRNSSQRSACRASLPYGKRCISIIVIGFTVGYRCTFRLAGDEIPLDNGKLRETEGRKATDPEYIGIAGLPKVGTPEQSVSVSGSFLNQLS